MSTVDGQIPHYDIVGSFLRPNLLKETRSKYLTNKVDSEYLRKVENDSISDLVQKEKAVGLNIVTDGEFRRNDWALDTILGFNGIEVINNNESLDADNLIVTKRITFNRNHPDLLAFRFLKKVADQNNVFPKQNLPSPAQCYAILAGHLRSRKCLEQIYQDLNELIADLGKAYHSLIIFLYKNGCRDIELDDRTWSSFNGKHEWKMFLDKVTDFNEAQRILKRINDKALANLPNNLNISMHVCHGDSSLNWFNHFGYDSISDTLFNQGNIDRFLLACDDHKNDFSALKKIDDQRVGLGLVNTKDAQLENRSLIIKRIKEAAQYVPLKQLYLVPYCGFSPNVINHYLTEEQQWAKIKLVIDVSHQIWN